MLEGIGRGLDWLARGLALLAALAAAGMVGLVVSSVAMRHIANAPFRFTEELIGLLLCASLFCALPLITLRGGHVRVTLVLRLLPPAGRRAIGFLAAAVMLGFCVWFTLEAIPWLEFAIRLNLKSEAARLLLYPWMALVPVTLALTAVMTLYRLAVPLPDPNQQETEPD